MPYSAPDWQFRSRLRIKHFLLLSELGRDSNLQRAARRLNITQPNASKLLRDAERVFGHKLFQRSGRGIVATEAGGIAVRRARLVLRDLDGAHEELAALTDAIKGRVTIGAYMVAGPMLMPVTVLRLRESHPNVIIAIEEGTSTWLMPALQRGELDCVIGRLPEFLPVDLEATRLYEEPPVVACDERHALTKAGPLAITRLEGCGWVLPPQNHPLRLGLEALLAVNGMTRPRMLLETVSLLTEIAVLRRTDALGLLPLSVARYLGASQQIAVLPVNLGQFHAPIVILVRRGVERSAALVAFLETLRVVASEIDSGRALSAPDY